MIKAMQRAKVGPRRVSQCETVVPNVSVSWNVHRGAHASGARSSIHSRLILRTLVIIICMPYAPTMSELAQFRSGLSLVMVDSPG